MATAVLRTGGSEEDAVAAALQALARRARGGGGGGHVGVVLDAAARLKLIPPTGASSGAESATVQGVWAVAYALERWRAAPAAAAAARTLALAVVEGVLERFVARWRPALEQAQ